MLVSSNSDFNTYLRLTSPNLPYAWESSSSTSLSDQFCVGGFCRYSSMLWKSFSIRSSCDILMNTAHTYTWKTSKPFVSLRLQN